MKDEVLSDPFVYKNALHATTQTAPNIIIFGRHIRGKPATKYKKEPSRENLKPENIYGQNKTDNYKWLTLIERR